jgi:hypothetical protein
VNVAVPLFMPPVYVICTSGCDAHFCPELGLIQAALPLSPNREQDGREKSLLLEP